MGNTNYKFLTRDEVEKLRENVSLLENLLEKFPSGVVLYLQKSFPFDTDIPYQFERWKNFLSKQDLSFSDYLLQAKQISYFGERFYSVGIFRNED